MGGLRKEHKTSEEKQQLLNEAISLFRWLVEEGVVMGNVTFPLYDGIVGKARLELFIDPLRAREIFRMGGEAKNANG
jgi:hypothetical protein